MRRLRELLRAWSRTWGRVEVFAIVLGLFASGCLSAGEKAVVRTVVEIAKEVCTPQDTLDACVDKLLADQRYRVAKFNRLVNEDAGVP